MCALWLKILSAWSLVIKSECLGKDQLLLLLFVGGVLFPFVLPTDRFDLYTLHEILWLISHILTTVLGRMEAAGMIVVKYCGQS